MTKKQKADAKNPKTKTPEIVVSSRFRQRDGEEVIRMTRRDGSFIESIV